MEIPLADRFRRFSNVKFANFHELVVNFLTHAHSNTTPTLNSTHDDRRSDPKTRNRSATHCNVIITGQNLNGRRPSRLVLLAERESKHSHTTTPPRLCPRSPRKVERLGNATLSDLVEFLNVYMIITSSSRA